MRLFVLHLLRATKPNDQALATQWVPDLQWDSPGGAHFIAIIGTLAALCGAPWPKDHSAHLASEAATELIAT